MSNAPNTTLYIHNLNDKINKNEIRLQLYSLFSTFGSIIHLGATKGQKMKGQAFLTFTNLASATSALRSCEGMNFYDKPLRIEYAKTKSYAALKREDPEYVPPSVLKLQSNPPPASMLKRRRDEDTFFNDAKDAKKRNVNGKDGDEMEMDDEEEQASSSKATGSGSAVQTNGPSSSPTAALVCTNLPLEVSDDVLAVLFQQYRGFQSTQVYNAVAGTPGKWAHVYFESPELATVARNALDGFTLKKGWVMAVRFS